MMIDFLVTVLAVIVGQTICAVIATWAQTKKNKE